MKQHQPLILSSSSPARLELLSRLKLSFIVNVPNIDETQLANEKIPDMVVRLAEEKARKSAEQYKDALIIGADTVGVLDEHVLGKPLTEKNAKDQLRLMSGKMVRYYIGLCLYNAKTDHVQKSLETFDVHFRELSDELIDYYLKNENALNCSGSFKAEGLGVILVEKFVGEDFSALVGLPLIRLIQMLENTHAIA